MRHSVLHLVLLLTATAAMAGPPEHFGTVKFGDPQGSIPFTMPAVYPAPAPIAPRLQFPRAATPLDWRIATTAAETPAPAASFAGVLNGVAPPPDTSGAASSRFLVAVHNGAFQVQTKSGAIVATMTDAAFWASLGHRGYYDPRVIYDRYADRWIVVEAQSDDVASGLAVAVSRSDDPSGTWDVYRYETGADEWFDSPQLGFNASTIVISVLVAKRQGPEQRRELYLLQKPDLFSGRLPLSPVIGPRDSSLTPVTVLDRDVATNYFLDSVGGSRVDLYQATTAGVTLLARMPSPAPCSTFTILAPQLGAAVPISTNDTRVANAVLRNGSLWFVQTCFLPAANPTHAALRWWKTTAAGQVLDGGLLDDAAGDTFYAFPSIAVNGQGDAAIGFSQFSARSYASAAYAFRAAGDPPGALRPPRILKAGEGPYVSFDNRWGDYSTTVVDPDDLTFWTLQEYAGSPVSGDGRWGTWWGHLPRAAAAPSASCTDADFRLCLANGRFAVGTRWQTPSGEGVGHAVRLTQDTGYFWFFGPDNVEVIVKVLDACSVNGRFWVFAAGLTDVHVYLDVTDTATRAAKTYENPAGTPFRAVQDTGTFVCP